MRVSLIALCLFAVLGSSGFAAIAQAAPDLAVPTRQLPNSDPSALPSLTLPEADAKPLDPEDTKAEIGEIRILNPPAATARRQPDVQLLLRSSVFSSSNITSLSTFSPSDTVFINSGLLLATPKLGETTRLIASAGGGLVRFANQGDSNYNLLNFNVAVQQRIAPGTYGQLGWVQENLYRQGSGDRLLQDNSVQLIVGRQDQLGQQLRLDSFYELRASFANPDDQNRVANTLGARLRYDITPKLQGALDYRLTFKNFTQVDRADTEHQISALAIYNINPDVFVSGTVSYLFGRSSSAAIDLDNLSIGLGIGWNVPLF
ncbi:MAG: outer membrane beta-barrel protein [Phormidesmis sp. CAN_BIN36]|nr:outer membrane beta-barrel protein [Phormidesmis sp. CAN_BIN36]